MTSQDNVAEDQTPVAPASIAPPAPPPAVRDKRRHSTGIVLGAGLLGGVFGALFTAGAAGLIMTFGFGPPPPPPGMGPGMSHHSFPGFPPPGPGGPMAGPHGGPSMAPPPMGPGPGMRPPFPGGPPPGPSAAPSPPSPSPAPPR